MTSAIRPAICLVLLAAVTCVGDVGATSPVPQDAQVQIKDASPIDLSGNGCRAVTNFAVTVPNFYTLRQLVPLKYTLSPSPATGMPIVYLHSVICEHFFVGSDSGQTGGFALAATAIKLTGIPLGPPLNFYTLYAVTNIGALHAALRGAGIDSHETTDLKLTLPSAALTVLDVAGGTSPFALTIAAEEPTVPHAWGVKFNFIGLQGERQTVLHYNHVESQPGYRGSGTFVGKEGTLLHKLLAGPPTHSALSVPITFKGSITRSRP